MERKGSPASATVGGVGLIVACFLASAALRLTESAPAFADGLSALGNERWIQAAGSGANSGGTQGNADADALLAAIREREAQLDTEEKEIADRAQALRVAEEKLAEQLEAFETARQNLEATLAQADKAAERDIDRMTTVYENMKPADAAQIFDEMEVSFASGILARMRPEVTASVLAAMEPETAYAVTLTIASRNARVPTE